MLKKTRVTGAMDMGRLGAAMARPGMDTRIWSSLAVVTDFNVDPEHGPLADIVLVPSGDEETARIGPIYAGNGFGFYLPLEVDDEVLVVAPSGEPDAGLVIVARLWSKADPPPASAANKPADIILFAKAGAHVHIAASGAGEVHLGEVDAPHPACRGDNLRSTLNNLITAYNGHVHPETGGTTGVTTSQATSSPSTDLSPNVKVK